MSDERNDPVEETEVIEDIEKAEKEETPEEIEKEYSPARSGQFYSTSSKYFVSTADPECILHIANDTSQRVVISKLIITSITSSIWDLSAGEIYSDGGVPAEVASFYIEPDTVESEGAPLDGLTVMTQDRNDLRSIRLVGTPVSLLYRLTSAYDTKELLLGDEILLTPGTSFSVRVRSESGANAPVSCEARFYLEKA